MYTTDTQGRAQLDVQWPEVATTLYIQCVIADADAVEDWAFSNTLEVVGASPSATSEGYLANLFSDPNPIVVQSAHDELLTRGQPGIAALLDYIQSVSPTQQCSAPSPAPKWASNSGGFFLDQATGQASFRHDSCVRFAMYTVDGILANSPYPYRNTFLKGQSLPEPISEQAEDTVAIAAYSAWWISASELSLAQLQAGPRPLDGASVDWAGGGAQIRYWYLHYSPVYECLAGTDTPQKKPLGVFDIGTGTTPSGYKYPTVPPAQPDGPTPQNCLGAALGIPGVPMAPVYLPPPQLGGPPPLDPVTLSDVMTGEGYTQVQDFDGQDPTEEVVMNVYVHKPGDPNPTDDKNWAHAMTRKWDPVAQEYYWWSKDGLGSMYKIPDDLLLISIHLVHISALRPGQNFTPLLFQR